MHGRFDLRHGGLATLEFLVSLVAGVLLGLTAPPVAGGAALPRVSAQSIAADLQTRSSIEWHRRDQDQPLIVPNRPLTAPAGGAGPSF